MQERTNLGKFFAVLIDMELYLEVLINETITDPQKYYYKLLIFATTSVEIIHWMLLIVAWYMSINFSIVPKLKFKRYYPNNFYHTYLYQKNNFQNQYYHVTFLNISHWKSN